MKKEIENLAKKLILILKEKKLFLATMESCSGGAIINTITSIPGASAVTKGGIVAYSTDQKIKFGVRKITIKKFSVYSKEVAIEMARMAQKIFGAQIGISTTGILTRPDPKNPEKKVGQVFFAILIKKNTLAKEIKVKEKNREKAKEKIVKTILKELIQMLNGN
ncbi:CinA family protein [Candidatus Parcubacteria bacterium]|nr:CinA family protein [Candidatus Parcubacteria bacterium]